MKKHFLLALTLTLVIGFSCTHLLNAPRSRSQPSGGAGVQNPTSVDSLIFSNYSTSPDEVGEFKWDSDLTGLTDGLITWYDSDSQRYLVDLQTLPSNDDYVVAYDADADIFYMKQEAAAGSLTIEDVAYDITTWNADTDGASKNVLRDYFALFDTDGDGTVDTVADLFVKITGGDTMAPKLTISDSATTAPLVIVPRTDPPSSPVTNDIYLADSSDCSGTTDCWMRYNGAAWEEIGPAGGGGATLTQEEVDDYVDALINDADSVHTRVTITYDDINNAMDFVIDDMNDDTPDDDSEVPDNITVNPINATTETAIETVVDLQDLQGAVTDAQVPDDITITESDPNALLTAGTDNVKDTHIDWGVGVSQVSPTDFADEDIGDITITTGVWAVEDDSHAHTTTSISGLDISADTNFAVSGDGLDLTDDTVSLDVAPSAGNATLVEEEDALQVKYATSQFGESADGLTIDDIYLLNSGDTSTGKLVITAVPNNGIAYDDASLIINPASATSDDLLQSWSVNDVMVANIDNTGDFVTGNTLSVGSIDGNGGVYVGGTINVNLTNVMGTDSMMQLGKGGTDKYAYIQFDSPTTDWFVGSSDSDDYGSGNEFYIGTTKAAPEFVITGGNVIATGNIEGATLTEGGNAVYNSSEAPGGELGGTWASPTVDSGIHDDEYVELGDSFSGDVSGAYNATTVTDLTISGETAGDVLYFDGSNWIRLAIGTPGQVLEVSATNIPEWDTDDGAGAASIENDVYGAGWDADTVNGASQNAIYDILHQYDADDDGTVDNILLAKDLVTTAPLTGGTDNILPGADADVTLAITVLKDLVTTAPLTGGTNDILVGSDADITIAMPAATTDQDGYITQTDWDKFNDHADDTTQAHSDYFLNSGSDIAGGGSGFTWTFNASAGADPVITFGDGIINVTTGALQVGGSAVLTSESDPNALLTAGTDNVKDTHIDWGAGAGQVDADDISDGSTNAIITLTQETNFGTAYTHSQDNTQAHSDYVLNTGADTLGAGSGFALTFDAGATDPIFTFGSDSVAITGAATFTVGGAQVQTGTDDDVPESGDFGAAGDLEADGTISADSVALTTDTTGSYVASITNGAGITGGDGGSEGAALTLAATLGTAITSSEITDNEIIEPDLNADNSPSDADILTYDETGTNFAWITPNAGTDITADLEEETHAAEHAVSGADTVFPADPDADQYLMWDDDPGALVWTAAGAGYTDLTEFVAQNNWKVFYSDGSGEVQELAVGADGEYLMSNGAAAAPTFEPVSGGSSRWTSEGGALSDTDADTMNVTTADCTNYAVGTPIRYSDDESTYYYGIVTACTDNGSDVDVDLDGYPLSAANDAYLEYGPPEVIKDVQLIGVGNCATGSTWFPKYLWSGQDAELVRLYIFVDTAPTGAALEGNVEINGANGFSAEWSIAAAGTSTDSGITVDLTAADRTIEIDEFIEIDISQCGSTIPGGNAAWAKITLIYP